MKGFSLLELLVVLTLLGLISAILLPNITSLVGSVSARVEIEEVRSRINSLGIYAATEEVAFAIGGDDDILNLAVGLGSDDRVIENWTLQAEEPVRYRPNGVCLGGAVELYHGDDLYSTVTLEPPYCQLPETL